MPRSTRQIPSETKKANSDSSSVTKESLISTISRGCHTFHPARLLPSHIHASVVIFRPYSVAPCLSFSMIVPLASTARLLSPPRWGCPSPVVLTVDFVVFSLRMSSYYVDCITSHCTQQTALPPTKRLMSAERRYRGSKDLQSNASRASLRPTSSRRSDDRKRRAPTTKHDVELTPQFQIDAQTILKSPSH